jgi:DNA-directed RNA polymerase subunit RPC12/RpoP
MRERYGLDELGKVILLVTAIFSVCGGFAQNTILYSLGWIGIVIFVYRTMSKQIYDRSEENTKFLRYMKLWSLKMDYRKTARIYMCPQCGKMIRVPKGRGKIQITCPKCGNKITRRT